MTSESSGPGPNTAAEQPHYFRAPRPGSTGAARDLDVTLAGRDVTVTVTGGVFSTERLDLGTRVLLREVPAPPPEGDLLDLGCGWGPVALTQALLSPAATVWAVDVNPQALELTRRNAERLSAPGVRVAGPDDVPPEVRFAAIWSNPPIRIGKSALHDLLLRWLPRLLPGGQAHLVVQRNLGADSLHAWLTAVLAGRDPGWVVERAGSAKGYRVLRITSPT